MSGSMKFVQECPTCGRRLEIRVKYLGRAVRCQHCQGEFLATDPLITRVDGDHQGNDLLRRADELLGSKDSELGSASGIYPR